MTAANFCPEHRQHATRVARRAAPFFGCLRQSSPLPPHMRIKPNALFLLFFSFIHAVDARKGGFMVVIIFNDDGSINPVSYLICKLAAHWIKPMCAACTCNSHPQHSPLF